MDNILMLLVAVTILGFHGFGSLGCHEDELDALLHLKSVINYPNVNLLPSWKEELDMGRPSNCCNWERVSCGASGRVVFLDLGSVRDAAAQGDWYVNASVFLPFRELQVLWLFSNSITGWTRHLRQLSPLQVLYLDNNKLKGMIDLYDVEALQNLEALSLSSNCIDGFQRIHGTSHATSKLKWLYLNNITPHDENTLLNSLSSFPSLMALDLQENDFTRVIKTTVFRNLQQLWKLVLSGSSPSKDFLESLGRGVSLEQLYANNSNLAGPMSSHGWICGLQKLEVLEMGHNYLQGQLPWCLANLTSLLYLDLQFNQLVGNVAISPLTKLTSLQTLLLHYNNFQIPQTFRSFANHSSLQYLALSGNDVIPDYSTHQPFITRFQLSVLTLSNCSLGPRIPDFIFHQYNLRFLDLSLNHIGGSFPSWIVENNTFLDTLILSGNLLMGSLHLSRHSHSQIRYLDVSQNNISDLSANPAGPLSSDGSICGLKKLQSLFIQHNDLQGQLPWCLANLTSLVILALASNQLVGNVANSPITKLTSLELLSLSYNRLQIPRSFRSFANHSRLHTLGLSGNDVISDYTTHLPFISRFQPSTLALSGCNLGPTLPDFLLHQYNFKELILSNNHLGGSFPSSIVENNTFLVTLDISQNTFTGSLHLSRHSHSKIASLYASFNNISYLSANLSRSFPNLSFLDLGINSIKDIAPIKSMSMLNTLMLNKNNLSGELPKHFIEGCHSLGALNLAHNNLRVVPSLSNSSSLKILILSNNNFTGMIPSSLFPASLVSLDMSNNHLLGQIPVEICKLNFLTYLDLSNNSLSGFLPSCFNSPHLEFVFLNKNKLNGPLLPVFKNSTFLVILDLGDNHLSGVIPNWIGDIGSLGILSLRYNHFEGHIPTQICSLNKLSILDLSRNSIFGQVPRCLGQMTFLPLEKLSMFKEVESQIHLIYLFWNEMHITTKSHTYIYLGTDLDSMSGIDLSCNKLSGEIPREFGGMHGVRGLNLSHNNLNGPIPSTLSKLSHIESLDLSYNNLNGSIPSELIQLTALEVFIVAHNNLSGRTPERKAQFATFEESSYEGNPFLCGPPLLNDCSTSTPVGLPKDRVMEDVDVSMDMDVFYICFTVSSVIMFAGTLIVLYVNPHWRRVWFYYGEMWITWVYYIFVDGVRKAWNQVLRRA